MSVSADHGIFFFEFCSSSRCRSVVLMVAAAVHSLGVVHLEPIVGLSRNTYVAKYKYAGMGHFLITMSLRWAI